MQNLFSHVHFDKAAKKKFENYIFLEHCAKLKSRVKDKYGRKWNNILWFHIVNSFEEMMIPLQLLLLDVTYLSNYPSKFWCVSWSL